jgi:hypothetical protein
MAYTDIDKSDDYFNTVLYTGNGATNNITGVNFQPDLVWVKDKTVGFDHVLQDSVRGTTKIINSNQNYVEFINADSITSFDSDGWTTGSYVATNISGTPFVAWNWLAANGTASNTDGSITSTVSANTTSGFSIVSYTGNFTAGATVGHGLGVVPSMYIIKNRDRTEPWMVYHQSLGNTKALYLNTTNTELTSSVYTNNTSPTSSVFSLGGWEGNNGSSEDLIAYCFAEKKGFSKFGSYTGNGSTNGTFVYTGFKPAWIMIKSTTVSQGWGIWDNKRTPANVSNKILVASASVTELTGFDLDMLSNGFKLRSTDANSNQSSAGYVYMALAENPFVTSTGIAGTAR